MFSLGNANFVGAGWPRTGERAEVRPAVAPQCVRRAIERDGDGSFGHAVDRDRAPRAGDLGHPYLGHKTPR